MILCRQSKPSGAYMVITQLHDAKHDAVPLLRQRVEFLNVTDETVIRSLVLSKPDQIDLVSIELQQDVVRKQVSQFYRTFGAINSYVVHPSLTYILTLSENGLVYIFNIADGDIRGRIQVDQGCLDLIVDPSGMFLAVSTPSKTVQMYEVGTGRRVYEFEPEFEEIGQFTFSNDSITLMIMDGTCNHLKRYEIDYQLSGLSARVLIGMKNDPDFWAAYPINLVQKPQYARMEFEEQQRLKQQNPNPLVQQAAPLHSQSNTLLAQQWQLPQQQQVAQSSPQMLASVPPQYPQQQDVHAQVGAHGAQVMQ